MGWKAGGSYNSTKFLKVKIKGVMKFKNLPDANKNTNKYFIVAEPSWFHKCGFYKSNGKKWVKA